MRWKFAAIVLLISSTSLAGEIRLRIPTDPSAQYFVLQKAGTATSPTLITKRVGSSGASFSHKLFDCTARTFKYLGDGDTLEAMKRSKPPPNMGPLVEGSISYYQWRYACGH